MTHLEAYTIDKGIRLREEIISSHEKDRAWKRQLESDEADLESYARPLKNIKQKEVKYSLILRNFISSLIP